MFGAHARPCSPLAAARSQYARAMQWITTADSWVLCDDQGKPLVDDAGMLLRQIVREGRRDFRVTSGTGDTDPNVYSSLDEAEAAAVASLPNP